MIKQVTYVTLHKDMLIILNQQKAVQDSIPSRVYIGKKKTMKKMRNYLLLLVAVIMLAACSNEESSDDSYAQNAYPGEVVGIPFATYEAEWVINRNVVDYTTMTYDGHILITHFPNIKLLNWIYERMDLGDNGTNSFDFEKVGNSAQQQYFNSVELTSYKIDINGISHTIHLDCQDGSPTAIYDQKADRWMITWQLTGITLTNDETGQSKSSTYPTVNTMILITTKRAE